MYHILEGSGMMVVGEERYPLAPDVTVIAPAGVSRGIEAETRLIFLGAKST